VIVCVLGEDEGKFKGRAIAYMDNGAQMFGTGWTRQEVEEYIKEHKVSLDYVLFNDKENHVERIFIDKKKSFG